MATGWTVRGSTPGGGENFRTRPDRPWGPRNLLCEVESGRGVTLTPHPLLVPRSKNRVSYTSTLPVKKGETYLLLIYVLLLTAIVTLNKVTG
jgi:hypothetical protein